MEDGTRTCLLPWHRTKRRSLVWFVTKRNEMKMNLVQQRLDVLRIDLLPSISRKENPSSSRCTREFFKMHLILLMAFHRNFHDILVEEKRVWNGTGFRYKPTIHDRMKGERVR